MAKVTLNDLSKALGLNEKEPKKDFHYYGTIVDSNPEDNTYQVSINRDTNISVEAARLVGAARGDTVMVTVMANGYATVTGRLGGDLDATDAQRAADNAADVASSAMGTASSALTNAQQANQAATAARTLAEHAEEEAGRAHTAAEQAAEDASSAATSASQAASSASSANTSAQNAAADASRAAASASSAETDAARASTAATNAESDAASAASNASRAATSASNAEADAASAATSAQNAANDASSAASSASSASTSASNAAASASTAQQQASAATTAANEAKAQAQDAETAANEAKSDANDAKRDAASANAAANGAVASLAITQGVVDALGQDMDDMQTHVAMMDAVGNIPAGLHVVPSSGGYFMVIANDGVYVYDNESVLVAKYGHDISFDSNREHKIGNNTNYIRYYDANNDGVADSIEVVANNIRLGSYSVADKIAEAKKAGTDAASALSTYKTANDARVKAVEDGLSSTDEDLANYITSQADVVEDLQNQIDGAIDTWYYSGDPTLSNQPAVAWTTDETKENHLRDLYFNTQNGHSFRFAKEGNTYKWIQIQDADAIKALADAAAAQGTANVKKRVFVTTPYVPYDVGDLWVGGSQGDIKKCKTSKTSSQSYAAADWELASKYTDDTYAKEVEKDLHDNYYVKTDFDVAPDKITATVEAAKEAATQAAINDTAEKYYKKTDTYTKSEIEQKAGDISLSVAQKEVSKVEIGGRNLLLYTNWGADIERHLLSPVANFTGFGAWHRENNVSIDYSVDDEIDMVRIKSAIANTSRYGIYQDIELPQGTYVLSADVGSSYKIGFSVDHTAWPPDTGNWQTYGNRIYKTFDVPGSYVCRVYIYAQHDTTPETISYVNRLKLERGNKPTDWTPAPEDAKEYNIGGRNLLKGTGTLKRGNAPDGSGIDTYSSAMTITETADGMRCDFTNSADGIRIPLVKDDVIDTEEFTVSFDYRGTLPTLGQIYLLCRTLPNVTIGSSRTLSLVVSETEWQHFEYTGSFPTHGTRKAFAFLPTWMPNQNGKWIEFKNGSFKLEIGNTATRWSPAPEDLEAYTDAQVNAAKAEIKITTDEISSEVSKINSAKYVESSTSAWSLANIQTYSAEGAVGWWGVKDLPSKNIRIGDTVYVKGYDNTRKCTVYCKITVTDNNGETMIRGISHGYEDVLPVETIKSTINQSADSVKIQARHVDIEGAAIFNDSGRLSSDSLNDKYDELVDKANTKAASRGEQLVTNGNGMMGDNTNFSKFWTFDGSQSCDSPGSFTRTGGYVVPVTDEYFPIDTSKRYRFEFDMKSANNTGTMYSMLCFYDVDKAPIMANTHMYVHSSGNTLTTLAQDLKAGDTSIKLTDASGYSTFGTSSHMRAFIFWDWTNSFGYTYPPKTYSRDYMGDAWVDDSSIDKTTNTITLKTAYTGPTKPAGTYVSQGYSGGNYKYGPLARNKIPTEWTHYVGYFDGVDYSGDNKYEMFPPGTAYAKVGFLWNDNSSNDQFWVTNIQVYEDYKTDIDTALAKKSVHTLNTPYSYTYADLLWYSNERSTGFTVSSTTGVSVDDTVRLKMTVSDMNNTPVYLVGTVTEIVNATSLRMISHGLDTTVIDGGNILTNSITANQIKGNTLTLGQIDTNVQNSILNENIEVGGRNLVTGSYNLNGFSQESSTKMSVVYTDEDVTITNISSGTWGIFKDIPAEPSTNYTISFTCSDITGPARYSIGGWKADGTVIGSSVWNGIINYTAIANGKTIFSFETPEDCAKLRIYLAAVNANSTAKFKKIKLEKGNKATDWTPAPEDVQNEIDDAAKTATDYLTFTEAGGLTVGKTGKKERVNIKSSGLNVYDSSDASVAEFGSTARIGKSNSSRFVTNASSLEAYNSSNQKYFEVSANGITFGTNNTVAKTSDIPTKVSDLNNDSGFQNASQVESTVTGKGYQTASQVEATVEEVSQAVNTLSENVNESINSIAAIINGESESDPDSLVNKLKAVGEQLADLNNDFLLRFQELSSFIAFKDENDAPNLVLGNENSEYNVVVTNTALVFRKGNSPIAYMNGQELYVENSLSFGNFRFYQRDNGHFTLKYIGGGN